MDSLVPLCLAEGESCRVRAKEVTGHLVIALGRWDKANIESEQRGAVESGGLGMEYGKSFIKGMC